MKKIIFLIPFVFAFFISINSNVSAAELDYKNGWFDQNVGKYEAVGKASLLIDNQLDTLVGVSNGALLTINFKEPTKLDIMAIYNSCHGEAYYSLVNFYDANDNVIYTYPCLKDDYGYKNTMLNLIVSKIVVKHTINSGHLKELEFFEVSKEVKNVKSYKATESFNSMKIDVEHADATTVDYVDVYVNDERLGSIKNTEKTIDVKNLQSSTKYKVSLVTVYKNGEISKPLDFDVTTVATPKIPDGFVAIGAVKEESARINFSYSVLPDYPQEIRVFNEKNELIKTLEKGSNFIDLGNLKPGTTYEYSVDVLYLKDNRTEKKTFSFTTKNVDLKVSNVKAIAKQDRVDLSWSNPKNDSFSFVRIYRKNVGESKTSFVDSIIPTAHAAEFEPIFETNGDYFNDLTVKPDTSYTYKLASVNTAKVEVATTQVDVKTAKVQVEGGGITEQENGDFLLTWNKPTTGKLKVIVGGKEYKIVNASSKQLLIPKNDMKYTPIGAPDIKLVPLDDDGKEIGTPSIPGGGGNGGIGGLPGGEGLKDVLDAEKVLEVGVKFLALVGGFILLGLSFRVVPKLVKMIRNAFSNRKDESVYGGRRRVEE